MPELKIQTHDKSELIDITEQVQRVIAESGIQEGMCYLFAPHTTAGIMLNENWDTTVKDDILSALKDVVPSGPYSHREGNSPAHIKSALVGSEATLLVEGGQPLLGTWQGVFLAEFDGSRNRRVLVRVTGLQKAGEQTP